MSLELPKDYIKVFKKTERFGVLDNILKDIKDYICSSAENQNVGLPTDEQKLFHIYSVNYLKKIIIMLFYKCNIKRVTFIKGGIMKEYLEKVLRQNLSIRKMMVC